MLLPFLNYFVLGSIKICICSNECHVDCPINKFYASSKSNFYKYLFSYKQIEQNIELFLYSKQRGFIFSLNQTKIKQYNISIQTLHESQPVQLKINQDQFTNYKIIEIKPNYGIKLPKLEQYLSKYNPPKMNTLEANSSEIPKTIPISIGISHMKYTGYFSCQLSTVEGIFKLTNQVSSQNFGCEYKNLDSPNAYRCGLSCWSYLGHNTSLEYTFKGVKFQIYGTIDPSHGKFNLQIDDGNIIQINEYTASRSMFTVVYTSELLEYKEHKIKIYSDEVYEIYKLTYWPSLTAKRLNVSDIVQTSGNWTMESDGIGGNRNYTESHGSLIVPMHCRKFWFYGLKDYYYRENITIKYGDVTEEIYPFNAERIEQTLLYESPELDDFHFNLNITGIFMFSFLYYEDLPIPISIGLSLMDIEGAFHCFYLGGEFITLSNYLHLGSFNCNYQNLDSINASKCGLRCWSHGNSNLGYTFKGVKFAIYGVFDNIHGAFDVLIDGRNAAVVNEQSANKLEYTVLYTSRNLEYGEHNVKIQSKGNVYEIYKLVYWPSLRSKRINVTEVKEIERNWTKQSDGIGGVQKFIEGAPGKLEVQMHCTRFRIYGLKDNYGNIGKFITINYNGINREIDLNATKRTDITLLYESEDLSRFNFPLTITGSFMLSFIYYDEPPIPISVSLDQMETEGSIQCMFSEDGNQFPLSNRIDYAYSNCNFIYLDSPDAYQCGLRCTSTDGNYSYSFRGIKFAIYGASNLGPFDIEFNDIIIATVEKKTTQNDFAFLYESEVYNINEHRVRIISKNSEYLIYKLVFWPSYGAQRINSTHFTREGNWLRQSDGIGGVVYYSQENGCKANITVKCSQFWVYGITDSNLQEMTLSYNGNTIIISQHSDNRIEGALLYQSPKNSFSSYELFFTSSGASILYCIYCDTQIPQPTITPVPISVNIQNIGYSAFDQSQINLSCKTDKRESVPLDYSGDLYCDLDNLDTRAAYQCGVICEVQCITFVYKFKGVKVGIVGQKLSQSTLYIGIDHEPMYDHIEIKGSPQDEYETLYTSPDLPYGEHTFYFSIKQNNHDTRIFKVVYWPSLRAKRLNSSEFMTRTGIWTRESDRVGGVREYTRYNDPNLGIGSLSKRFSCSKFWLYGSRADCFSQGFTVSYNGITDTVSDLGGERKDGVLLYESSEFTNKAIIFKEETRGESMFYFVYYIDGPLSLMEYIDKEFNELLPYHDIFIPHDSYINQISGCKFYHIVEYLDYLITLEKEVLFNDNCFYEVAYQVENPTPLLINYSGSIRLKNCTFININGRSKNSANIFYCSEDHKIDAIFDSCKFINCGNESDNHALIIINNCQSSITLINCIFYSNSHKSCKPFDLKISNAVLLNCSFTNTGGVYIKQQQGCSSPSQDSKIISITDCAFDSCYSPGSVYSLGIQIELKTNLKFDGNEIKNINGPDNDVCIVKIDTNNKVGNVDIENVKFTNNTCYSLYGGGSGFQIRNSASITFYNCSITNNKARKCITPRLSSSDLFNSREDYHNGDGGGIQIGFGCTMNEVLVKFENCSFKDNKAERHGGAIAIQTLKSVEITGCTFESNKANFNFDSSTEILEYESHYYKKIEGRGGAIYINPAYSYTINGTYCYNQDLFMNPVSINNCQFVSNSARDGYAIYIEGDDPGTDFIIKFNNFSDNYNFGDDESSDPNITVRGVITTEIHSITKEIFKTNQFYEVHHKKLTHVDHYGNKIATKKFSRSQEFTFSNHFTKSTVFSLSQKFTKSNDFLSSNKFTQSSSFSSSNKFTQSSAFSSSNKFTQSSTFSSSSRFTNSLNFIQTLSFSPSSFFTPSKEFMPSYIFSSSSRFTQSSVFSGSLDFSQSSLFTPCFFTSSNEFTSTFSFSISHEFSKSTLFTQSFLFTNTFGFTNSQLFEISDHISHSTLQSNSTFSLQLTESSRFTNSKDFSNEVVIVEPKPKEAKTPMIIGISIAIFVIILSVLITTFIILKKKKQNVEQINKQIDVNNQETNEKSTSSIQYQDESERDLNFWL